MKRYFFISLIGSFFFLMLSTAPFSAYAALYKQFGFLADTQARDRSNIVKACAGWARPHPGPFLWGRMQDTENGAIDFSETDTLVKRLQKNHLSILATIWPYATWDQKQRSDADSCINNDEFTSELGKYRCNPNNWNAYTAWVTALVERYDGDGKKDMPGLKKSIRAWEVMNEPDLQSPFGGLQFYMEGATQYRELLIQTYDAIKKADPKARVLIASSSDGSDEALEFYRSVLSTKKARNHFDVGNIHCISCQEYESFNVESYKEMLQELRVSKPIWVTEAEAFLDDDAALVATQIKLSTQNALALGAKKIFYTSQNFTTQPGGGGGGGNRPGLDIETDPTLDPNTPLKTYKQIFMLLTFN